MTLKAEKRELPFDEEIAEKKEKKAVKSPDIDKIKQRAR